MTALLFAAALFAAPEGPIEVRPPADGASEQALPVLTLADAVAQARAKNQDLKVAEARLVQARELSRKLWAAYLPQVSVGGGYTRNSEEAKIALPADYAIRDFGQPTSAPFDPSKPPGLGNPPGMPTTYKMIPTQIVEAVIQPKNQWAGQAQISQALIVPALWPALENASLVEQAAELGVQAARREILFAVAQLYYGAASVKEAVSVQEKLLQRARAHEKDAEAKSRAGLLPKAGLLRARLDRVKAEQDLRRTRNGLDAAKSALGALLDRGPDFDVVRPPRPEAPNATDEGAALAARPDVQAARVSLRIAERLDDASWLKYAPTLGLQAQYRWMNAGGFTGERGTWAVTLGASWTIWDGGVRESEAREAAAKRAEAYAALQSAEARARDELRRAALDLESAKANLIQAQEQVELAREAVKLVQAAFDAGTATYLEVADANAGLAGAEVQLVSETLASDLAALRLAKAAGAFDP